MANGYPISALVGKNSLKEAAKSIFQGTQFFNAAPMAAANATIKELIKIDAIKIMNSNGERLRKDLISIAKDYGFKMNVTEFHRCHILELKVTIQKFTLIG